MTVPDQMLQTTAAIQRLIGQNARVVIATSGGPDSQALLHVMARLKDDLRFQQVWAVGIDHGLRAEAKNELVLAKNLAEQHGIAFFSIPIRVPRKGNLLAQARKERYRALQTFAKEYGADCIATAHTATDQAETVLLNLTRGCGVKGAAGMQEKHGSIVRPLLTVTRDQIFEYLKKNRIPYAMDPSNKDSNRARTQLRENLLPILKTLNPRAEQNIERFTRLARADENLLSKHAAKETKRRRDRFESLHLDGFEELEFPVAVRVLQLFLSSHHVRVNQKKLSGLYQGCCKKRFSATFSKMDFRVEQNRLWCEQDWSYSLAVSLPGRHEIPWWGIEIAAEVENPDPSTTPVPFLGDGKNSVAFDLDHLHLKLRIRSWEHGDHLVPFGLSGHKQVGDMFTDAKIPTILRPLWPVVVHGEELIWVVGLRRGNTARISPDTKRVLWLQALGNLYY